MILFCKRTHSLPSCSSLEPAWSSGGQATDTSVESASGARTSLAEAGVHPRWRQDQTSNPINTTLWSRGPRGEIQGEEKA